MGLKCLYKVVGGLIADQISEHRGVKWGCGSLKQGQKRGPTGCKATCKMPFTSHIVLQIVFIVRYSITTQKNISGINASLPYNDDAKSILNIE